MRTLLLASLLLFQGGGDEASGLEREAAQRLESAPGEAVELLRRALVLRERESGEAEPLVRTLNSLSYALSRLGEHEEALAQGERALAAAQEQGGPSPMSAAVLRNLAGVAEQAAQLDLARHYAEASVADIERSTGKTPLCGEYREFCARLALRTGDTRAAIEHLGWSLAIYEKAFGPGSPERLAGPLHELARALRQEGRLSAALDLHERALRLLESTKARATPAWMAHAGSRVAVLEELGESDAARRSFAAWIAALEPSLPEDQREETLLQWARRFLGWGRAEEARELLARAPVSEGAELHALRADAAVQSGRWQEALEHLDKAEAALAGGDPGAARPIVPELAWLRARAELGLGEAERAFDDLRELFQLEREQWGEDSTRLVPTLLLFLEAELAGQGKTPELVDSLDLLEGALRFLGPEAGAAFQRTTREQLRRSAWDPALRGWLHLARKQPERLPATFAALDRFRQRALLEADAVGAVWIERAVARQDPLVRELCELLHSEPSVASDGREALRAAHAALLERARASGSPWARALAPQSVALDEVQARLEPEEALVSITWTTDGVAAVVVPATGNASLVELGQAETLWSVLGPALEELRDSARPCDLAPLAKLVLQPLWSALETCTSAVVVADGPLAFLPFEALPTPPSSYGEPWVASCRVTYAPTVSSWMERAGRGGGGAAGEGDARVAHVQASSRLPSAVRLQLLEGRAAGEAAAPAVMERGLARQLPPEDPVLASELALKRASEKDGLIGLRLLEVRAPLYIDATVPAATSLALGSEEQGELSLWEREDGLLDLAELRELDLAGAKVVAWNAHPILPEDGTPRSEGLHGLVTALLDAGAHDLWIADHETAHDASFNFDNALLEQLRGDDPGQALVTTQRRWLERAKETPHLAHPAVWARLRYYGR